MSLINEMLRDLESRRKSANRGLTQVERPTVQHRQVRSWRPLILLSCGLLLIVLAWLGVGLVDKRLPAPTATVRQVVKEAPAARIEIPPKALQSEPASTVTQRKPDDIVITTSVAEKSASEPTAVAKELSPPAEPVSQPAPVQISKLRDINLLEAGPSSRMTLEFEHLPKYSWKYSDAEQKQLQLQFKQVAPQASTIVPQVKGPLLTAVTLTADRPDLQLLIDAHDPLKLEVLSLPEDRFHGPRLLLEISRQVEKAVPPVVSKKPAEIETAKQKLPVAAAASEKKLSKTLAKLTPRQQAEQAYREALGQLQKNEHLAAETNLSHALTLQPTFLDARLQLVALLQQADRLDEAEQLLVSGLQLHPENPELRKSYARRLLGTGNLVAAVDLLQSASRPTVASDLEYHALLAALQQELGQHQAAASNYRLLLAQRPQAALWWFGLAISLDQSGQAPEAKEAYQRARTLPGLREDLKAYANERLEVL